MPWSSSESDDPDSTKPDRPFGSPKTSKSNLPKTEGGFGPGFVTGTNNESENEGNVSAVDSLGGWEDVVRVTDAVLWGERFAQFLLNDDELEISGLCKICKKVCCFSLCENCEDEHAAFSSNASNSDDIKCKFVA